MSAEDELLIVTILEEGKDPAFVAEPPYESMDWKGSTRRRRAWAATWRERPARPVARARR